MQQNPGIPQDKKRGNPTSPDPKTTTRKKWSKWLKFSGSALLLFAFGMQMRQNSQSALFMERTQAAELDSRTLQKAIAYETLYFAARSNGVDNPPFLTMAAKQYFTGSLAMMATAPGLKNETVQKIQALENAAAGVHDIASLNEFITMDNRFELEMHANEMVGLREPDRSAKFFSHLYLILYVLGSVTALIGQALD
jgi:hypothetical protein